MEREWKGKETGKERRGEGKGKGPALPPRLGGARPQKMPPPPPPPARNEHNATAAAHRPLRSAPLPPGLRLPGPAPVLLPERSGLARTPPSRPGPYIPSHPRCRSSYRAGRAPLRLSGGAGRGRPRRPSPGGRCPPRRAVLSASAVSAGGSPARRREGGEESRGHDRAPSEVHARPPPCPGPRRHLAAGSAPSGGRRRCAGRDGHRARCDGHRASPSAPRASGTAACRSPASPSVVSTGRAARGAVGTAGLRRAHGSGRRARGGRWALGWAGGRGRRGALRGRARGGGRRGEAAVRFWSGAWRRARGGRGDARGPREGRDGTAPAWPAERAPGRSRGQGGGRAQETY